MSPGLSAIERSVAHQAASLLLGYPDEGLLAQLPMLARAAAGLPGEVGRPLTELIGVLQAGDLAQLQAEYVRTIDQKRSCAPFLTYYAHGDTRRRGMALVRFHEAYREAGVTPPSDELPDHLGVVLEFAATVDAESGIHLLQEHRSGLELLRRGLERVRSPYSLVLDSVLATLPPPSPEDLAAAARIAEQGPPTELVGISPYSPASDTTYPADDSLADLGARR